jgi:uncharacterized membrane protein YdjX (TVP38/TMEM64 family)
VTGLDRNTSRNNGKGRILSPSTDNGTRKEFHDLFAKPHASPFFFTLRKDFVFIAVFVLIILLLYLSPLQQYVARTPEICEKIKELGIFAPLVFTCGVIVLVGAGVPRLLLCPIGGMAFGFFWGLMYCVAGTVLAYYGIFLFVRWGGRNYVSRRYPKINHLSQFLEHGGIPAVILARQMPLHGMVINIILGLSPVRQRDYLIGTAIGLFPEAIPFTLIGKGIKQGSLEKTVVYIVLALIVLALLWLGLNIWTKKKEPWSMGNER